MKHYNKNITLTIIKSTQKLRPKQREIPTKKHDDLPIDMTVNLLQGNMLENMIGLITNISTNKNSIFLYLHTVILLRNHK